MTPYHFILTISISQQHGGFETRRNFTQSAELDLEPGVRRADVLNRAISLTLSAAGLGATMGFSILFFSLEPATVL